VLRGAQDAVLGTIQQTRVWHQLLNENEPIVCTPEQAIDCFQRTRMDVMAIGPFVAVKPEEKEEKNETAHGSSEPQSRDL
jgi:hypothetical protein